MLIDSHIHIGQFFQNYFAPSDIHLLMKQIGLDYYAVSSTTQCDEDYPKVIYEIEKMISIDGEKVLPIMWITPEGLKGNIAWFLESPIKWKMLKIHPFLNKKEWNPQDSLIYEVLDITRELNIPLLIHTGEDSYCQAGVFETVIQNNNDIRFVLAHGRPLDQAIALTQKYDNAYADSAFMPVEHMKQFVDAGLSHKLLWGTDMCIPKHFYPEEDMAEYYMRKLNTFKDVCSKEQYEQVIFKNAVKLFCITMSH